MTHKNSILTIISALLIFCSCGQTDETINQSEATSKEQKPYNSKKKEPHRYGGWYCPDNFGFVPVNIQKLDQVPAIANRLPSQEELHDNKSLINVDTAKYPDARALKMDLPRVAMTYSERLGMKEVIVVIQAIVIQEDTVVGYRFANGGNGSARINEVTFLSDKEVDDLGSQPFFYSKSVLKSKPADIWSALGQSEYFKDLGVKFNQQEFFSEAWNPDAEARLELNTDIEKAKGYVGMVFGNYYLHIDYNKEGFHYSEKLLMIENKENKTTELFFASGPYPKDFEKQQSNWKQWVEKVRQASETKSSLNSIVQPYD